MLSATWDLPGLVHTGIPASLKVQARKCIALNAGHPINVQGRGHVKSTRRLQFLGTSITRGASPPLATQSWPLPSPARTARRPTPPRPKRREACECSRAGSASSSRLDEEDGEAGFRTNASPCPTLSCSPQPAGHSGPAPSSTSALETQQDPRGLPR